MDIHGVDYRLEMAVAQRMGDDEQDAIQKQKELDAEQQAERDRA